MNIKDTAGKGLAIRALCKNCPILLICQSSNIEDCERREMEQEGKY